VEPYADALYDVGYKVAGQDIGLDPNGHRAGAVGYVAVTDIKARLQSLLDVGAEVNEELNDVGKRPADRLREGPGREPDRARARSGLTAYGSSRCTSPNSCHRYPEPIAAA
jgi:hypothetical protein